MIYPFILASVQPVLIIAAIVVCAILAAAVVVAIVRKMTPADALKVFGLGIAFGVVTVAAIVIAIIQWRKHNAPNDPAFPADSGSASIGTAFDQSRDRLRAALKKYLQQS
jgi:hypothetical protein